MGKSKIIRINENDLKRLIAEKINEYSDWKTQMLAAGNRDGYKKAQKLASRKHDGTGVSDNGTSYRNFVSVEPESGFFGSEERTGDGNFMMHGTSIKPKSGDNGDIDSYSDTITKDGFVGNDKCPISSPEAEKFQDDARKDMEDYYSGNFKKRMQSKAKSLPNADSGQDFTPSALKENAKRIKKPVHINESHIKQIIKEIIDNVKIQMVVNDFMNAVKNAGNLAELLEDGEDFVVVKGDLYNEYYIAINITERPGWVETRSEDYWSPAEYDLAGNLYFEIEEIWAEDAESDVRSINLYDYLSKEQKKEVKDAFDFDEEDFALDADEYEDEYGYDEFDRADDWWEDHKLGLDENIVKNVVRDVISEITRKQKK